VATLCVYCSSSDDIADIYPPVAKALGTEIADRGHRLIYGGGRVGLMGVVARAVHEADGHVTGVIPEKLEAREGIAYEFADEMIVTDTMAERKEAMYTRAEGFAVLPGGYGTLEEFLEVLTLRQLDYHSRPIALVNTDGFYDPLLRFFDRLYDAKFARVDAETHVHVTPSPEEALDAIENGLPADVSS
jgi:cytokinin riboside 5'-monophosphate phosphoribohydrolase